MAILIPLGFREIKTAVVLSPLLIMSAQPSGAIEVDWPMLLLSMLETMRRYGLCSHRSQF